MPALVTSAEVNAYANVASADADYAAALIGPVSDAIEKFLGYKIVAQDYVRTWSGTGTRTLVLPDRPLISVASVTISGRPCPAGSWGPSGQTEGWFAELNAAAVSLSGTWQFWRGTQNVTIAYRAGYEPDKIPKDLKQACLEWVKFLLGRKDRALDVTSEKAGGQSLTYGGALAPMPALTGVLLGPHRRVTPC